MKLFIYGSIKKGFNNQWRLYNSHYLGEVKSINNFLKEMEDIINLNNMIFEAHIKMIEKIKLKMKSK